MAPTNSAYPRWYQVLLKTTKLPENGKRNVYQIATVDAQNKPHVRSLVHRAFVVPKTLPSVPLFLTSTDIRTPKIAQLSANPFVELAWWLDGTQEQFRISGRIVVVPHPDHPLHHSKDQQRGGEDLFSPGSPLAGLSESGEEGDLQGSYDWDRKRLQVFDAMSGHMKASWCHPTPGSPLTSPNIAQSWPTTVPTLGSKHLTEEEKRNQEEALKNFALVLIEPLEVDWLELGVIPNRRTRFVREAGSRGWSEMSVAP